MLFLYETRKKKIIRTFGVSMPELFILFYFYDGSKKAATPLYEEFLIGGIGMTKGTILRALKKLYEKKYLERHGTHKGTEYSITSMAINIVNDILVKYITAT